MSMNNIDIKKQPFYSVEVNDCEWMKYSFDIQMHLGVQHLAVLGTLT